MFPIEPTDEAEQQGPTRKLLFENKISAGTLLTILTVVVAASVLWGETKNRLEVVERKYEAQAAAMERQTNTNQRLVDDLHAINISLARLQQQFEDRQYQQDVRQDRLDARDKQRK